MSISQTHKEYVLERLLLDYLYQGIIPTSDTLEDDLDDYLELHPDLALPLSATTEFDVEKGNESSASLMYTIADTISKDVGMATREIYRLAQENRGYYERWLYEMKRLSGMARKLEDRVNALLLLTADTVGFYAHVGDVFADMNQIDLSNTTAKINLHDTSVSIEPSSSAPAETSGATHVNLNTVMEDDVIFSPLSRRPGISYTTLGPGVQLSNIFKATNESWVGIVSCDTPGEMISELKAQVSRTQDLEISKITMEYTGPNATDNATITCQYSLDGYNWYLVPTDNATKSLSAKLAWYFPAVSLRWIKFIIVKPSHDSGQYSYEYSISHIRLYGQSYELTAGNELYTKSLQALDAENNPIPFSLVGLAACEELYSNTDIQYYISASKDDTNWTTWARIAPIDRENTLYPKIINLGGADWKHNKITSTNTQFDSSLTGNYAPQKITRIFGSSYRGYNFKDANFGIVNTAISVSVNADPDPVANSVKVWRNVRYRTPLDYPDTLTVRDTARGWGFDGNEYSCYFEVKQSEGILIDFGGGEGTKIDDFPITGAIQIPVGVHKFTTIADNWFDISDNLTTLGYDIETEDTLATPEVDPLYPYNHKLLIEGFPYKTNFEGEQVYHGTDISAEYYAIRKSLFDLEYNLLNEDDYGYFAVRSVGDSTNPTLGIILRYNSSNPDYTNELNVIEWRSGASDAAMYTYIKMKAVLQTEDTSVSPVITSYRLKLGL